MDQVGLKFCEFFDNSTFTCEEVDTIATTRIIPLHITKGTTLSDCLSDRIDYGLNPDKTENGTLITTYACDYQTAVAEFLLSKRQYKLLTGREERNEVIAYQVRQSFRPGEVTAKEANQIGYEFAKRFLKGSHAFIVCTHTDKHHIHNHIYWNSTALDCRKKFRNFWNSTRAVARLSDLICIEHELSVIANPRPGGCKYHKWLGYQAKPSHRELLRIAIDNALDQKPSSFDELLSLIELDGYIVFREGQIKFYRDAFKKKVRMNSLGEGYSEEDLRAVIAGQKTHLQKKRSNMWESNHAQSVIDIQAKLAAGKGEGYRRWATVENLKRMAKTKLYMDEHGLSYDDMAERKEQLSVKENELSKKINQAQARMAEIQVLQTHIVNYSKTRDIYVAYRKSGYSKKFLAEHEADITIRKAAKKAFDEMGVKKLPTRKSLNVEFADLLAAKKSDYAELKKIREELRDLAVHKANYEELRHLEQMEMRKEKEHDR